MMTRQKKKNTLTNSSSGTCNFFCMRILTSARVSASWMTKKKGSPKFCACWKRHNLEKYKKFPVCDRKKWKVYVAVIHISIPSDFVQTLWWSGKHESSDPGDLGSSVHLGSESIKMRNVSKQSKTIQQHIFLIH